MSDISNSAKKIHIEETDFRSPMGESMLQKMGGSINYILDELSLDMVGDVTYSVKTEAALQLERGAGWVLCDGRTISTSTKYYAITGQTVIPDFRGIFLRAKNNGVSPSTGNPNGERALGFRESASMPTHTHFGFMTSNRQIASTKYTGGDVTFPHIDIDAPGLFDGTALGLSHDVSPATQPAPALTVTAQGGVDNSPKNVTLNVFVRIN